MISSDIIRGHLDAILLVLIGEKDGHLDAILLVLIGEKDRYGYEISREISLRTQERFQIKEATLYAVFQRLEKRGFIRSYEGSVTLGGKRRYYAITAQGRAYLAEGRAEWQSVKEIIDIFLEGKQ